MSVSNAVRATARTSSVPARLSGTLSINVAGPTPGKRPVVISYRRRGQLRGAELKTVGRTTREDAGRDDVASDAPGREQVGEQLAEVRACAFGQCVGEREDLCIEAEAAGGGYGEDLGCV
jgi:hypothetical protein